MVNKNGELSQKHYTLHKNVLIGPLFLPVYEGKGGINQLEVRSKLQLEKNFQSNRTLEDKQRKLQTFGINVLFFLALARKSAFLRFYCLESVDKEFAESDVQNALIVSADNKGSHGDDILLVVVLDFLQTAKLALAGLI